MCKLSIITVNLNNRFGLQKTITSVSSQTYRDYEYIIIDGASKDGSVDILSDENTQNFFKHNNVRYQYINNN